MNTVLLQELLRYNSLLSVIHTSLHDIQKATRGLVVMSAELEAMFDSMIVGKVCINYMIRNDASPWNNSQQSSLADYFLYSEIHHHYAIYIFLKNSSLLTGSLHDILNIVLLNHISVALSLLHMFSIYCDKRRNDIT